MNPKTSFRRKKKWCKQFDKFREQCNQRGVDWLKKPHRMKRLYKLATTLTEMTKRIIQSGKYDPRLLIVRNFTTGDPHVFFFTASRPIIVQPDEVLA